MQAWVPATIACAIIAATHRHKGLPVERERGSTMGSEDGEQRIRDVMADLRPHRLDSHTLKTKQLKFRLRDEEFEDIRETAESLGLSITEYFCALHRYARPRLTPDPNAGNWLHPVRKNRRD